MSLRKAFGRIGSKKCKLKVIFTPISVEILTSKKISFKLQVKRGDHKPVDLAVVQCPPSLRNTDIKSINFNAEEIPIDSHFYIEKGIPLPKIVSLAIIKMEPGSKEVVIARGDCDIR